ncbi:vesicular inhibitory amino acid transporter-like [Antennarius striatus]|uniref:vesicular inhibitory amino acid transporter-like n=1 Tax=Antennarius striatus TaxID=241820 RepID=UPI0035B1133E
MPPLLDGDVYSSTVENTDDERLTLQTVRLKMSSLDWVRSSGQAGRRAGSLWGWVVSRLHLNWTTRFFQEDEEMLILTHSDDLNRTYQEENRCPFATTPNQLTDPDNSRSAPNPGISRQQIPAFKDTRASIISSGPSTMTVTSVVSTTDWVDSTRGYGKRRRSSTGEEPRTGSSKRRSYRLARQMGGKMWKERLFKDGGQREEGEETGKIPRFRTSQGPKDLSSTTSITAWEAGWNVTNAIQGIFVLGLPLALVRSGYVGLLLLGLSAWVCNHTGRILVDCLYEDELSGGSRSKVRVRHSYQDIVEASCKGLWPHWPGLGGWMVNVAQIIELLMTCTLYLVVSTSLLSDTLSGMSVPPSACSLASLLFLLPCLRLTDLKPVSTLSLLCSVAHILISLLVMLYCLSRASSWSWSCLSLSVDPDDFLVSVGVIIFSYTSQIFLPQLEGSMEDRGQFKAMLGWTHAAACVMKTMFSLLAVLTWGTETSEVITDNLPSDLRPLVNLCLLAKALLSYPLPFYSAAEILQSCLLRDAAAASSLHSKHGGRGVSRQALLVRGALLMTSYLLALLVPRFSLLMGLTGSVTGAAMTLVLPCLCHLRLQGGRLSVKEGLMDVCILSLGVVSSVSGVICSIKRLMGGW